MESHLTPLTNIITVLALPTEVGNGLRFPLPLSLNSMFVDLLSVLLAIYPVALFLV
jgi:hypothetical protein